jgi:hypothetical protein
MERAHVADLVHFKYLSVSVSWARLPLATEPALRSRMPQESNRRQRITNILVSNAHYHPFYARISTRRICTSYSPPLLITPNFVLNFQDKYKC